VITLKKIIKNKIIKEGELFANNIKAKLLSYINLPAFISNKIMEWYINGIRQEG